MPATNLGFPELKRIHRAIDKSTSNNRASLPVQVTSLLICGDWQVNKEVLQPLHLTQKTVLYLLQVISAKDFALLTCVQRRASHGSIKNTYPRSQLSSSE